MNTKEEIAGFCIALQRQAARLHDLLGPHQRQFNELLTRLGQALTRADHGQAHWLMDQLVNVGLSHRQGFDQ